MKTQTLAEKIFKNLYRNPDEALVPFTQAELPIKKMYEDAFAKLLSDPDLEDKHIINMLQNEYNRSVSQAYRDIAIIKSVLGNVQNAKKEWHLYTVIKMCKEAYALAKTNKDYDGMTKAADKLGKYTKLDQSDIDEIPWDQIIPPSFEPSSDPTLLGIPNMPTNINELKRKLREKYISSIRITDAVEISDDGSEK